MLYFSYGSNMSSKRLLERVPSARFITTATLARHQLRFHKAGTDNSAKCDAHETGNTAHAIIGVVFEIAQSEKPELDKKEDLGNGYAEKIVTLHAPSGEFFEATTYYAIKIDATMKPYHWYKQHVVAGAEEFGLAPDYVAGIRRIESIPDPQPGRQQRELSIYE
jgi:hypothetical protein